MARERAGERKKEKRRRMRAKKRKERKERSAIMIKDCWSKEYVRRKDAGGF